MAKVKRNIEGLALNAQKKRKEAFEKVEKGIQELLREQRVINFNTVAEASDVSKAWLYKEPEVRERIEFLREKNSKKKKLPPKQRASDASKDAIIRTVRERSKKIDAENRELRKQAEVLYGKLRELNLEIQRLTAENQKLKTELWKRGEKEERTFYQKSGEGCVTDKIQSELEILAIKLSSTLRRKIESKPEEIVMKAIEAFKQNLEDGIEIHNPGGWLVKGIEDEWVKNETLQGEGKSPYPKGFEKWYREAVELGFLVDIPIQHLNLDGYGQPKVKVNKPDRFAPYTEMGWKEAKEMNPPSQGS